MYKRALVLSALLALPLGGASDGPLDRATMRGIPSLNVVIDPVSPEIAKEGATAEALQSRLQEQLRGAGITIDPNSTAFVGFRLSSVRAARGPFAIAATISLYQPVILARDQNMKTVTQTWEVDTVALADAKEVTHACMDSIDDLARRFVTAYRTANPK